MAYQLPRPPRIAAALLAAFLALTAADAAPFRLQPKEAASATQHLYIIDFGRIVAVLMYRLKDGVPGSAPDREITGLVGPIALTVGASGYVYVLDQQRVKVFAPGASGQAKPVRIIDLPQAAESNIGALAVDANGYEYVGQKQRIFVYGPTANGRAKPVASLRPPGYPSGLTLDAAGELYVLGNKQRRRNNHLEFQTFVAVYATPETKPTKIRAFCTHVFTNSGIDYGVALDGLGNLYTTHPYFVNGSMPAGLVQVFNANANTCPVNPTATISSTQPPLLGPVYLAVASPYVYVYDYDYGFGAIFTLTTTPGQQKPLDVLQGSRSQVDNAFGIAIGP